MPVVTKDLLCPVLLAGRPADGRATYGAFGKRTGGRQPWTELIRSLDESIEKTIRIYDVGGRLQHRRGTYSFVSVGPSLGGGQKVGSWSRSAIRLLIVLQTPVNQFNDNATLQGAALNLWSKPPMRRIDGFERGASLLSFPSRRLMFFQAVFTAMSPQAVQEADVLLEQLQVKYPGLHRVGTAPFAAATVNFNNTATYLHTDFRNWGPCVIVSGGSYNPVTSGHLILWELKLYVEFPPGSVVFLPSALITHGNTPLQNGETRFSITRYTAAALHRFAANGFRTLKELKQQDPEQFRAYQASREQRVSKNLSMIYNLNGVMGQLSRRKLI